jgi:hypothetical protein
VRTILQNLRDWFRFRWYEFRLERDLRRIEGCMARNLSGGDPR